MLRGLSMDETSSQAEGRQSQTWARIRRPAHATALPFL